LICFFRLLLYVILVRFGNINHFHGVKLSHGDSRTFSPVFIFCIFCLICFLFYLSFFLPTLWHVVRCWDINRFHGVKLSHGDSRA
jgi:hypothetical protein